MEIITFKLIIFSLSSVDLFHFHIDWLLTFHVDDKMYYVNSDKDMALALSSDMDDLWIAVLLQSLFLLQYCPLLRVLSIAL